MKEVISTSNAPAAIGPYSQAVKVGNTVYLSGQIAFDPATMELVEGDIAARTKQIFANLGAVCEAAGGSLQDIVKVNIFLTEMADFAKVNEVMAATFVEPFPARATVGVKQLPRDTDVEIEAVMVLSHY